MSWLSSVVLSKTENTRRQTISEQDRQYQRKVRPGEKNRSKQKNRLRGRAGGKEEGSI